MVGPYDWRAGERAPPGDRPAQKGSLMLVRERVALTVPPLILRVLLAATFLWLGLGGIFREFPVQGEQAAALANAGVIAPPGGGTQAPPEGAGLSLTPLAQTEAPPQPEPPPPPAAAPRPKVVYFADQFPTPINVRRVHWLTLKLIAGANPGTDEAGNARLRLWPAGMAQGPAPAAIAWAATLAAIFGGIFVLIGLTTRFWALAMVVLAAGAIWLTVVGPAAQASGGTSPLPPHDPFDVAAWIPLAWQVSVLMAGLALLFGGPGAVSVDRPIFRGRAVDDDED